MQSGAVSIPLAHIYRRAAERPPGYTEEVLTSGVIRGDVLEITPEVLEALRRKYDTSRLPALSEMLGNFIGSAARWVAAGFPIVDQDEFNARISTCHRCPRWDPERLRCGKCGCGTVKHWLASEECPEDRWPRLPP